jgi:transposase InsO family protein
MNPDETLLRYSRLRLFPGTALQTLLKAQELVGLAPGLAFFEFRDNHGRLGRDFVDARLDSIDAADAEATARLLRERLEKLPERRRPYYTPEARFAIPDLKKRNGWSAEDTARRFALSPNTIYNWLSRVSDESETVGSLVAPTPPVRRIADVVHELVRSLDRLGFGGSEKLAQVLARTGYRLSARSVGRFRKEIAGPAPSPAVPSSGRVLRAKFPNHIFMADVTEIPSRFRLFGFHLAVVLDVFSRMPLAWEIFYFKPTARQMARLFQSAVRRFGKPRYFVSDHGTEFRGKTFRRYLGAIGVKHRFGAVGRTGSIAIIERFWRKLKDGLRARYSAPPLILAQLEHRVRLELLYYAYFRPHQALDGATPSE